MFELDTELERLRYADNPLGVKVIISRYLQEYGNLTFMGGVQLDDDETLVCGLDLDCCVSHGGRTEKFSTLYEVEDTEGRKYQFVLSEDKGKQVRKLLIGMEMEDLLHVLIALSFDNDKKNR